MFKELVSKYIAPALIFLIAFFVFLTQSLVAHNSFNTHGFDLGVYTQTLFLYSSSNELLDVYNTIAHIHPLANHFEPILYFFVPIYYFAQNASVLLWIQAFMAALSVFWVYFLAFDILKSKKLASMMTVIYITSSGILYAVIWDFHTSTISVLPLTILIYAFYKKRRMLYWVMLLWVVLFKEDILLLIIGFGAYQIWMKSYMVGVLTMLFGFFVFGLIIFLIPLGIKLPQTEHNLLHRITLSNLPFTQPEKVVDQLDNPVRFFSQLITPDVKLKTANLLVGEYLYLPLLQPLTYFVILPNLFFRFVSNLDELWVSVMHYNASLQPFLIYSTILSYEWIQRKLFKWKNVVFGFLLIMVVVGLFKVVMIIGPVLKNYNNTNAAAKVKIIESVVGNTSAVSAQDVIVPHLANRNKIYLYPDIGDAEFVVLDSSLYEGFYYNKEMVENSSLEVRNSEKWSEQYKNGSLVIYKRK